MNKVYVSIVGRTLLLRGRKLDASHVRISTLLTCVLPHNALGKLSISESVGKSCAMRPSMLMVQFANVAVRVS